MNPFSSKRMKEAGAKETPKPRPMGCDNPANKEAMEAAGVDCGPVKKAAGGSVKKYAKGGKIDGAAQRGKTRGKVC